MQRLPGDVLLRSSDYLALQRSTHLTVIKPLPISRAPQLVGHEIEEHRCSLSVQKECLVTWITYGSIEWGQCEILICTHWYPRKLIRDTAYSTMCPKNSCLVYRTYEYRKFLTLTNAATSFWVLKLWFNKLESRLGVCIFFLFVIFFSILAVSWYLYYSKCCSWRGTLYW